jgi:hypothetical protein
MLITEQEKIAKVYNQILTEQRQYLVESSLNRILDTHTKNGYIIISSYRGGDEKSDEQNTEDFLKIKKDVREYGFSYIPVFGGFIENIGKSNEREVREPALFVPNYKVGTSSPFGDDSLIKRMGVELSKKYNQDSFLYKPRGGEKAHYIDKNGNIEMTFNNKTVNDLTQIYFTDLAKNHYAKGKRDKGLGKSTKRFSFTENVYLLKPPVDLNDAKKRYGELFFSE